MRFCTRLQRGWVRSVESVPDLISHPKGTPEDEVRNNDGTNPPEVKVKIKVNGGCFTQGDYGSCVPLGALRRPEEVWQFTMTFVGPRLSADETLERPGLAPGTMNRPMLTDVPAAHCSLLEPETAR
jgi:hypothetical protein